MNKYLHTVASVGFLFTFLMVYLLGKKKPHRPRGIQCRSVADRLLGFQVRIPREACMSICCKCCVLSGRDLCVGLITRPDGSYRVWCV